MPKHSKKITKKIQFPVALGKPTLLVRKAKELRCTNGHDRCYMGPDEDCPYCE